MRQRWHFDGTAPELFRSNDSARKKAPFRDNFSSPARARSGLNGFHASGVRLSADVAPAEPGAYIGDETVSK
jgi:hypothetical protein